MTPSIFKKAVLSGLTLVLAGAIGAADMRKAPIKLSDVATRFKYKCPKHVTVSDRNDVLTVSISECRGRGGFDAAHALDLKALAGRTLTFTIDVRTTDVRHSSGNAPGYVGKFYIGAASQNLSASAKDWHTYVFRGVKIPGNGLLKIRLSLKNVSGKIDIRNPRVKGNLPKAKNSKEKKKKKKSI